MPAGTFTLYNGASQYIGDNTVDLDGDAFAITLHGASYTPAATHDTYANLTNELPTSNGYTNGGATLTGVTWNRVGGVTTWSSNNQVWTAAGGSLSARYAVIRSLTANKLIGYLLLDTAPADLTATDGNTLTVGPHATQGWFQHTINV
jgi:hypothetical protein